MAASTTGSLTATGSVTLTKPQSDTMALVQVSGTYGTVSFVIEGTFDGTIFVGLAGARVDTSDMVTGTISPADNATLAYRVACEGMSKVRVRATAVGSGTLDVSLASGAWVGSPVSVNSQRSTVSALTLSGDLVDQFSAASASGAVTQKSGIVYITKAGVAALTIADPTATTDDGKVLRIISATANAHTLDNSAGSGFNAGGAGSDVGTFGGAKGDNIVLTAYQGKWYVLQKTNVTLA